MLSCKIGGSLKFLLFLYIHRYLSPFSYSLILALRMLKASNSSLFKHLKDNFHYFALSIGKDSLPISFSVEIFMLLSELIFSQESRTCGCLHHR